MHLYLDESGDLGFNFDSKSPSKFFIITLLVCDDYLSVQLIKKAAERTIKNKIHAKSKHRDKNELKGISTNIKIKTYFFHQAVKKDSWKVYSIVLDKKTAAKKLLPPIDKHRIYNVIANHLLKQVDFSAATTVNLFVDRSKGRDGIKEFDSLLRVSLDTILPLNVPLNISHVSSHHSYGIQIVDLFCWGIFRKYEQGDEEWYNVFKSKVVYEQRFLS